jgi:hypothetical protein
MGTCFKTKLKESASREMLLVFLLILFIFLLPLQEIQRIGCLFIIFIDYFLMKSLLYISEVLRGYLD